MFIQEAPVVLPDGKDLNSLIGMVASDAESLIKQHNPDFTVVKSHRYEQYQYKGGSHFLRILFNDDNTVARFERK